MSAQQNINIESIPSTEIVVNTLKNCFESEEIDLRDVSTIIMQDPIMLVNTLLNVNKIFSAKKRPVVNTLSAAINLVGIELLKETLFSIESTVKDGISEKQLYAFNLVRNRIYQAAILTQFWGEFIGEKASEELYCVSMFTGLHQINECLLGGELGSRLEIKWDSQSVEDIKGIYCYKEELIEALPDSIQQLLFHSTATNRLKLSILVYQLISALELGVSSQEFNEELLQVSEFLGVSEHRASYDLARQIVSTDANSNYQTYHHSHFLIGTNTEAIDPFYP